MLLLSNHVTVTAAPVAEKYSLSRRWLHTEQSLHDRHARHDPWLRELESSRQCVRTFEVGSREHCQFLSEPIHSCSQTISTLNRHLAIAKHVDLETTQQLRSREQFVQLADPRIQHFKTSRRIDRRECMRNFELLLEPVITGRTTINNLPRVFEQLNCDFFISLLHVTGNLYQHVDLFVVGLQPRDSLPDLVDARALGFLRRFLKIDALHHDVAHIVL